MTATASGWGLLRSPSFRVYWLSGLVSGTGTWVHNVTASVLMLTLTGSAFMVGLVSAATYLPMLLLSLPAGALSDRFDRRRVVVATQSAALLVAVALAVSSATGHLRPVALLVSCFLIGSVYAVAKPSLSAMLPALVPRRDLVDATAFNILQFNLGQVVGPALATVILLGGSPAWAFGLNAVSFVVQILAVRALPAEAGGRPDPAEAPAPRRAGGVVAGLRFIRTTAPMPAVLVAVVLCNAPVEALRTLAPTVSREILRGEGAVAGIIIMAYSLGALAGLLTFSHVRRRASAAVLLGTSFGLQLAGLAGLAMASTLAVVVAAAVPVGVGFSLAVPVLNGGLQQLAADHVRGRVMATFSMAHLGSRPFFAVAAGGVASLGGARVAFGAFAVLAAGALAFAWARGPGATIWAAEEEAARS